MKWLRAATNRVLQSRSQRIPVKSMAQQMGASPVSIAPVRPAPLKIAPTPVQAGPVQTTGPVSDAMPVRPPMAGGPMVKVPPPGGVGMNVPLDPGMAQHQGPVAGPVRAAPVSTTGPVADQFVNTAVPPTALAMERGAMPVSRTAPVAGEAPIAPVGRGMRFNRFSPQMDLEQMGGV